MDTMTMTMRSTLIVDHSLSILVDFPNQLIKLFIGQAFSECRQRQLQVVYGDHSRTLLVKHLKRILQLFRRRLEIANALDDDLRQRCYVNRTADYTTDNAFG